MDQIVTETSQASVVPTFEEVQNAVRVLLAWAGDNPGREGLKDTPARVAKAYQQLFAGYHETADDVLKTTFGEVAGYQDVVIVRDIPFFSHCEHHMLPFHGVAHVAYVPSERVVGLSKIARLVELFARRLQIQERMTSEIAVALDRCLQTKGAGVIIEAEHMCMSMRGVSKSGSRTLTSTFNGMFQKDPALQARFFSCVKR
ncbi:MULTISPECIES: GTP cyclohydrolase I FolE [Rhizobium]|uniref:GTP cyclohydrolase 1 n=1 Tax=Rhizobium tropici TaxID=398 RepID=A0A6P1C243_RHITR|nr:MULTISPECIES: GTP cyclohydrolase I FolE [Rhizobium]AGB73190.1 GTP cyclohydrolase I [Rhizobium tropici CIAT 899]MBB4245484.1 GTP cyclohydrolase I [Rhizobium tropici]MBB5595854.1 GTP cyclohydrolase I [Rhizobium tropici]MBB6493846.1 GTP cyclohydrolase I [Rhizobium tropici]NEV11290.1 GTP cyclohydrolase I FolE [Rhizobium tropici]